MSENNFKNVKNKLIKRFEKSFEEQNLTYFDVSDIETIVEYYIEENNVERAKKAIDYGKKLHGETYNLIILEAKYQIAQLNFTAAEKILRKAEIDEPHNGEVDLLRAMMNIFMKNFSKADKLIKKGLKKSPDTADYLLVPLGMAFMQQKRYIEAATFMKKFWERYEDAEEIIKEIASAYYQAEKYHLALKFYQQHIDAFPYDDEAWSQIARVYTHLNMFEEGLEAYDFALSINPDQIKVVFEKGSLFLLQNKAIEALDCFKEYLKKEKNGRILQKIGESYLALNKYHDALSYFEQSQTFADTDTIDLYYAMSKAYLESGKTEKAYLFIEKAIHQDELNTRFWLLKGIILTKQMQFAKAEEAFQSGLKINDKEPELWLNYSELHFQQNNIKKSIDILESALIRLENNALLLFRLSAYLLMEKNSSEAERKFDKALQIDKECLQDFINFYPASLHLNFVKAAYYQFTNN